MSDNRRVLFSHGGPRTSGYTVQPVTVSPQRQAGSETFAFFLILQGNFSRSCTCTCTWGSRGPGAEGGGCNPRRPPSHRDEQRAARTASVNRVLCATCGIFITGGGARGESDTFTHAHSVICMTRMDGGRLRPAEVGRRLSAPAGPPAFQHHPRTEQTNVSLRGEIKSGRGNLFSRNCSTKIVAAANNKPFRGPVNANEY